MPDKRQLCADFTQVIGMIATKNDEEVFREKYLNNPMFSMQVKKIVVLLMQCVTAYESDEAREPYAKRKAIESEINTLLPSRK